MGGRGSGGTRNSEKGMMEQLSDFFDELKTREYGSNKPGTKINDERSKEFRRVYYDMMNNLKNNPENMNTTVIFASGFRYGSKNPDTYVHTIQKLNTYQRLVQSEVRRTALDLRLKVIDEDRARLELRALKNLDAMIKDRKASLRETIR